MPEASGSREMVRSVAKTLDVIRAFDAEHRDLTLSDVARRTGQTRASARRFLLSLEALGFVRSDGQLFSLTPRVLSLGHAFLSSLRLPDVAEPHLKALTADLGESTSASVSAAAFASVRPFTSRMSWPSTSLTWVRMSGRGVRAEGTAP